MTVMTSSNLSSDIKQALLSPVVPEQLIQGTTKLLRTWPIVPLPKAAQQIAGAIVSVDDQVDLPKFKVSPCSQEHPYCLLKRQRSQCREGSSAPYRGEKGQDSAGGWVRVPRFFNAQTSFLRKDYHKQIANFDFYSTIVSVVAYPSRNIATGWTWFRTSASRKRKNLTNIFSGSTTAKDAEEHLIAVRWKKWTLKSTQMIGNYSTWWPIRGESRGENTRLQRSTILEACGLGQNPRPLGQDPQAFQIRRSNWNGTWLGLLTKITRVSFYYFKVWERKSHLSLYILEFFL